MGNRTNMGKFEGRREFILESHMPGSSPIVSDLIPPFLAHLAPEAPWTCASYLADIGSRSPIGSQGPYGER